MVRWKKKPPMTFFVSQKDIYKQLFKNLRCFTNDLNILIADYASNYPLFIFQTKGLGFDENVSLGYNTDTGCFFWENSSNQNNNYIFYFYAYDPNAGRIYFFNKFSNTHIHCDVCLPERRGIRGQILNGKQKHLLSFRNDVRYYVKAHHATTCNSTICSTIKKKAVSKSVCFLEQNNSLIYLWISSSRYCYAMYLKKKVNLKWILPRLCYVEKIDGIYHTQNTLLILTTQGNGFTLVCTDNLINQQVNENDWRHVIVNYYSCIKSGFSTTADG